MEAIDWVKINRTTYNIRVVNISLGTPAIDSMWNDPLCYAVQDLNAFGILVVAAAGNSGKTFLGQKIYGQVHSPGNDPSVLTVGATNALGTDARADDTMATYSSHGPTRSYWTDDVRDTSTTITSSSRTSLLRATRLRRLRLPATCSLR